MRKIGQLNESELKQYNSGYKSVIEKYLGESNNSNINFKNDIQNNEKYIKELGIRKVSPQPNNLNQKCCDNCVDFDSNLRECDNTENREYFFKGKDKLNMKSVLVQPFREINKKFKIETDNYLVCKQFENGVD